MYANNYMIITHKQYYRLYPYCNPIGEAEVTPSHSTSPRWKSTVSLRGYLFSGTECASTAVCFSKVQPSFAQSATVIQAKCNRHSSRMPIALQAEIEQTPNRPLDQEIIR